MSLRVKIATYAFAACAGLVALSLGDAPSRTAGTTIGFSTADAIIGRPLTPMSYAGVARRTARRW